MKRIKRTMFGSKRRTIVSALVVLALIAVAAAGAAWLVTAIGQKSGGQFSSISAPTLNNVTPAISTVKCSPSSTCDANFNITNPNTTALTLTGVTGITASWLGSAVTESGGQSPASCQSELVMTNGNGGIKANNLTGLTVTVPPGTSTVTVPGYFTVGPLVDNACSGASFTINDPTSTDVGTLQFSG